MHRLNSWVEAPAFVYAIGEKIFHVVGRRKSPGPRTLSDARRILVVRLDGIGDVVLTSAFLRQLRRSAPLAKITLVVQPFVRNLVEQCPYVNEVLGFDPRAPKFLGPLWLHWRALRFAMREILPRRFDLAIQPRWDADRSHASFLSYFSGAPRRAGHSEIVRSHLNTGENRGWDVLLTDALQDVAAKHEVIHNADLLRFLGVWGGDSALEVWPGDADRSAAANIYSQHGVRPQDFVVAFGLGAGDAKRMWPVDRFVELAEWFKREFNAVIVVAGGRDEAAMAAELEQHTTARIVNAAGRATLRETAALLERAAIYIGNDTGAMHIAAAAGVKVIEISCHPEDAPAIHPNSPARFGPVGVPHRILQPRSALSPCGKGCQARQAHCILGVSVAAVQQAVHELLVDRPVGMEPVSTGGVK